MGHLSQEEADKALESALEYGVNMVDVAPMYGEAEIRISSWVQKHRGSLFIAEKTTERRSKEALTQLRRSLERLGIGNVDLYQFHMVGDLREFDTIMGKDGALEAFQEARDTGIVKYIGITGHKDMSVLRAAIERYDFDAVLLPVNLANMTSPRPENDFRPVLQKASEKDMAVIAIKAIAKRRWRTGEREFNTWYEPVKTAEDIQRSIEFTLSQKPVATYSLPCDVRLWPMVFDCALSFRELDGEEQTILIDRAAKAGHEPLFPTTTGEFS